MLSLIFMGHWLHFFHNSFSWDMTLFIWDMTHFIWDMTHFYKTWLILMRLDLFSWDLIHFHKTWLVFMRHDSFSWDVNHFQGNWLIFMRHDSDMTHFDWTWPVWLTPYDAENTTEILKSQLAVKLSISNDCRADFWESLVFPVTRAMSVRIMTVSTANDYIS